MSEGFKFSALNPWSREGVALWITLCAMGCDAGVIGAWHKGDNCFISYCPDESKQPFTIALGILVDVSGEKFVEQWKEGCNALAEGVVSGVEVKELLARSQAFNNLNSIAAGLQSKGYLNVGSKGKTQ